MTSSLLNTIPLLGSLSIHHYLFENGLQVAIVPDPTTPIFTYQTWFRVGSADEQPGRQGLAHLFEHMMFRKTAKREMGEFERLVNVNGGTGINAYTSRDQTVYFFTFPNDKLPIASDLEADRMNNLAINAEMFETEKGAVLTEKNRGLDDPMRYTWEKLYDAAYLRHPYRYSTIGEIENIKSFSVEDAVSFYRTNYSPNNALIIIVGDVILDDVLEQIDRYYGNIKPAVIRRRAVVEEPVQRDARTKRINHSKAVKTVVAKAWHVPPMQHPDYPALSMLGRLLTSGKSAILNERLLYRSRVTQLFADIYISRDNGTFEFFAQLADNEKVENIENEFDTAIQEIVEKKITDDKLAIVKNNLEKEVYQSVTSPASLARLLGDSYINTNDLTFLIRSVEKIRSVTIDEISSTVRRYFLEAAPTTIHLYPEKQS
jgi:zinc protease